jgi:isopenicillin N synthase-like dioxygenase
MWAVTKKLLRALAIGVGIPYERQDFFIKHHSGDNNLARLAYYPPISSQILEMTKSPRLPPHVDFSSITLLLQDGEQGGLEVEDRLNGGALAPVAPLRNAILISVGDVLQRWTNSKLTFTFNPAVTDTDTLFQTRSSLATITSPFHSRAQSTRQFRLMAAIVSFQDAIRSHTLSTQTPTR